MRFSVMKMLRYSYHGNDAFRRTGHRVEDALIDFRRRERVGERLAIEAVLRHHTLDERFSGLRNRLVVGLRNAADGRRNQHRGFHDDPSHAVCPHGANNFL